MVRQRQPLERVLPTLLEKSLERGWRVVVQASSDERVEALDAHLWTYRDDGFLPHGTSKEQEAAEQPILITSGRLGSDDLKQLAEAHVDAILNKPFAIGELLEAVRRGLASGAGT